MVNNSYYHVVRLFTKHCSSHMHSTTLQPDTGSVILIILSMPNTRLLCITTKAVVSWSVLGHHAPTRHVLSACASLLIQEQTPRYSFLYTVWWFDDVSCHCLGLYCQAHINPLNQRENSGNKNVPTININP